MYAVFFYVDMRVLLEYHEIVYLRKCLFSLFFHVALRAQSISVNEDIQYSFPSQQEIMQLTLPNSTLANISLSPEFIADSAAGI